MDMKLLFKGLLGIACLSLIACQDKETASNDAVKIAYRPLFDAMTEQVVEADSKVFVDENLMVLWHADDRVSIFDRYTYNQQYAFQGETGAKAGSFCIVPNSNVVVGNTLSTIYAVYPYDEVTTISNDCVLSLSLPAIQSYAEKSFGPGANTMVSATEDNQLLFKNAGGYLSVKLYGEGVKVKRVTLKGNNGEMLAGQANVTTTLWNVPIVEMTEDASEEVTVECVEPVTLGATEEDYTEFWFVLPPTEFTQGFTITVYDEKGGCFEQATDKPVSITRNHLSRMSPVEVEKTEPTIAPTKYLTFNSEGTTTILLKNEGGNAPVLYYSTDKTEWTLWDYSALTFMKDSPLYLCGENPDGFSSDYDQYSTIQSQGDMFGVKGDVMSLINAEHDVTTIPGNNCFFLLFSGCSNLSEGPELPATTLTESCYAGMFEGCNNLLSAPALPSTILAYACYASMFQGCYSLESAPELPATTLADACYASMFQGCSSLVNAPVLSATELADFCYSEMFSGCTSLVNAPDLPATTLEFACYSWMFMGCTKLGSAPALPATTLADECYNNMFSGCKSLTAAPELPAKWLADLCYSGMFLDCTSLTNAPELPATKLESSCYRAMFSGCTSLTNAPELPATKLESSCYSAMFSGCKSLTAAPELPAKWLADFCYSWMFKDCTNLSYIKCLISEIFLGNTIDTTGWLSNVSPTGTFVKSPDMNDWPIGESGIPEGWTVKNDGDGTQDDDQGFFSATNKYLTFSSEGTTTISLINEGNNAPLLYYSTDMINWSKWDYSELSFTNLAPLYLCGDNPDGFSFSEEVYSYFTSSGGNYSISGDIMSIINSKEVVTTIPSDSCFINLFQNNSLLVSAPELPATILTSYCYFRMFNKCSSLISAPKLPAMKLADSCYSCMFGGCSSLAVAPKLPATELAPHCYGGMFIKCSSLTSAPELPSTNLTPDCYSGMFQYCTSLTVAPELPATTLVAYCYYQMFSGCTSLVNAPDLPATTLAEDCYFGMFEYCTSLTVAPELPATTLADQCYINMFDYCTSLTSAPELPATTLARDCYHLMFRHCSSLTTAPQLPATTLAKACYTSMFIDCISLITAPQLPATTLASSCYAGMFSGCTSLTNAPELPATQLESSCYRAMFSGCKSLTAAPELPATMLDDGCYYEMFLDCTSLTTAPELPATQLKSSCYRAMFSGCKSLTAAPELPAKWLTADCYYEMFKDCTNLSYIKCLISEIFLGYTDTTGWLSNVSPTGTFVKALGMNGWPSGDSGIPEGWTVVDAE